MEEPSDGLHEKQKHGRGYDRKFMMIKIINLWKTKHQSKKNAVIKEVHGVHSETLE